MRSATDADRSDDHGSDERDDERTDNRADTASPGTSTRSRGAIDRRIDELGPVLATFFTVVVAIAGGSAFALLTWPADSGSYFSWDLGPAFVGAMLGGLYLGSTLAFVHALRLRHEDTLPLAIGVLGLALPTLWFTAANHQVFDWSRPQAIGWVALFASAPMFIGRSLIAAPRVRTTPGAGPTAPMWQRLLLMLVAKIASAAAAGIWFEPTRTWLAQRSALPPAGLAGDYLGCWAMFVATTAATATWRGRPSDVRLFVALGAALSFGLASAAARVAVGG